MNDFQKSAIALSDFQLDIEDEKQMESLYEKIKDLDCYDFRIFYLKAYHCYKKLGNPEEARAHIDKSIEAIPMIKVDVFSSD